jgi:hypothetical protein
MAEVANKAKKALDFTLEKLGKNYTKKIYLLKDLVETVEIDKDT